MIHQVPQTQAKELRLTWLYTVSGVAALVVGGSLVAAALGLSLTIIRPSTTSGWLVPLQNNWLILIFKLQAGFSDVQPSLLSRLNLLDFLILALVVIMYAGLYTVLRSTNNLWSIIALVQPILGIVLFMVTKTAGRSTVMGAELVSSVLMSRSKYFDKFSAYTGILSGLLLLAGDIGAALAPSALLTVLMGVGYVLLTTWFFLTGCRLLQFGQDNERS